MDIFKPPAIKAIEYIPLALEYRIMGGHDDGFTLLFQVGKNFKKPFNGIRIDIGCRLICDQNSWMIDEGSRVVERQHDLVVLSTGMVPAYNPQELYGVPVATDDGFIKLPAPNLSPSLTDRPGIFVTGTAAGPMDIVDSIVLAGAAAAETAAYLQDNKQQIPGNGRPATAEVEAELAHVS